MKMVGPAVRLRVNNHPRLTIAPERNLLRPMLALELKTQLRQALAKRDRLRRTGGELNKFQTVIAR